MIIAHGPLGFLFAWIVKQFSFSVSFTKKQFVLFFSAGFIGGIFPDIDLFFFYLVDATGSHRQFLTHTPIFYLLLFLCIGTVLLFLKKSIFFWIFFSFIFGTFSHLLGDGMLAQVMYLYPFSSQFYGLADLGIPFLTENLFFINFLVEGIFSFFFFYVLIWKFTRSRRARLFWTVILGVVFLIGVSVLTYIDQRTYHTNFDMYYDDLDNDGIPNFQDRDMDGDGDLNIDDLDSDADDKSDVLEIMEHAEGFFGVLYDPTDGGLIQIPARLGLVTNEDIVRRLYGLVGINIRQEMTVDYKENSEGYESAPTDSEFDRSLVNLRVWIDHRGLLETGDVLAEGRDQIGDVLFFESGYVAVVTGFDQNGKAVALDIQKNRPAKERFIDALVVDEGVVVARGKLLNSAPLFGESTKEN